MDYIGCPPTLARRRYCIVAEPDSVVILTNTIMVDEYDFIAIGGGRAGFAAVTPVAQAGMRTALVDSGAIGGLCALRGCNPKKVMVRSAEVLHEARHAGPFGIDIDTVRADLARIIDRKAGFTADVTERSEQILRDQRTEFVQGAVRFTGPNTLRVGDRELKARGIVVATGSVPRPLAFEGAQHVNTTDQILELRVVPEHLVCIGGGVVAFEFGHVFARLGSRVTILEPGPHVLAGVEPDLADALVAYSATLGVDVVCNAPVLAIEPDAGRSRVTCTVSGAETRYRADFVLNAAGRIAAIGTLDLDAAGVDWSPRGLAVTPYLRSTSNTAVFAAGDAHGRMPLSPMATYEGGVVARNFLEGDVQAAEYDVVPRAIYTIPPLASVGLTESEARSRGLDVEAVSNDMSSWTVFAIAGEPLVRGKVILERGGGRILGAHLLGPASGELIHIFSMAMRFGISAADLRTMNFAYPTFASVIPSMLG